MHGTIYLIINDLNLKSNTLPFFYIGSTIKSGTSYDNYFGSSVYLTNDIKLLGRDNFTKLILFESDSFTSIDDIQLKELEIQISNDVVNSPYVYNKALAIGNMYNNGTYTRNTIWINDGAQNKRINPSHLVQYPNWSKGRLGGKYMKDRIYINNGIISKSISQIDLHLYPNWVTGRLQGNQTNKIWINNTIVRKLIKNDQLDTYLSNNWTVGYKLTA